MAMRSTGLSRALVVLLLSLLLTACNPAWLVEWSTTPQDRTLARAAIDDLIAGNRAALAGKLSEQIRPQLAAQFSPMRRALPVDGITDIVLVDAGFIRSLGGEEYRHARLAYEIVGGKTRALAQMTVRTQGDEALLTSLTVFPIDRPAREINAFRPGDITLANFIVLVLAIAGLATTLLAIRRIWTSGLFERRWLWIIGCLLGLFRFTTVWGTAQLGFVPMYVTLFSSGAARQGLAPWTIIAGVPAVAIWALLRHRSRQNAEGSD